MENTHVWQYIPLHQKGVRVVIFFNKRMKYKGGGTKVNGLLQLDYSVRGTKALQTPNYEHGKGCKRGIARTPHQECLCAHLCMVSEGWLSAGEQRAAQAPISSGSLKKNLSVIWTPGGWVIGRQILKLYRMLIVSALLGGIHNLSADSYDWGETLTQCTTSRLPLFSCNILTRMTVFIV